MPSTAVSPAPAQLTRDSLGPYPVDLVLAGLTSENTRRSYATGIKSMFDFVGDRPITLMLLLQWRQAMESTLTSGSINTRIVAVRKLFSTAVQKGLVAPADASELLQIAGLPLRGERSGNWLDRDQAKALLAAPDRKTLRGKRNYAILALLVGCALRRYELAGLDLETVQLRDGRWVLADLMGKGGRVRTVAVPGWVKQAIDSWTKAAKIDSGRLIRRLTLEPEGLSDDAIWEIVAKTAASIGIYGLGPHDLRRTCAKLCRSRGGRIEQIQMMLGHASIQTTERYLGSTQDLKHAVNDDLGLQ